MDPGYDINYKPMDITKSQAGWHMMACNTVISASRIHDKPFSQAIDVQGTRRDTDPPKPQTSAGIAHQLIFKDLKNDVKP